MKKRDLLLAGTLLFGFSLSTQAQEQLFFFGFEDGDASFIDSANAPDSITQLQYYSHLGSNGQALEPEGFELGPTVDTMMYVLNGISPLATRGDAYEIVTDESGAHSAEFKNMGAKGDYKYFKYMAGGEAGGQAANDYEANLFVRALPITDNSSYRLSMYVKANSANGQLNIDLLRGFYNSEKQFSMTGEANSGEFKLVKNDFTTDRWERVTMMSYYQNDSVANRYMYQAGYWWADEWKKTVDGKDYNMIVQPDQYFVRLAFTGPGVTYYVDDMTLTKSWIAGAEYNNYIMRIDFGYDTNLAELAKATPAGAISLPAEYFSFRGYDSEYEDYMDIQAASAEYHSDGYLYMWLPEDEEFGFYDTVWVNFTNPTDEALQLKYDGDLYPKALDTAWVNAGKIVPDFSYEIAVPNPSVNALSMEQMPPIYVSSTPEEGSFNLDVKTKSFDVKFSKEVYVVLNCKEEEETGALAVVTASGVREIWIPTAYDEDTYTVTFSRQEDKYTTDLAGDVEIRLTQLRTRPLTPQGDDYSFTYSFGVADETIYPVASLRFDEYTKGTKEIPGLSLDVSKAMIEVTDFTGAYTKGLKFGLFGSSSITYAPAGQTKMQYKFTAEKTGKSVIKIGTTGCLKNSWNDGPIMDITLFDPSGRQIAYVREGETQNKPSEGGEVATVDEISMVADLLQVGEYTMEFFLPNEQSNSGHLGGRIIYYVDITVQSAAAVYLAMFNNAISVANDVIAIADNNKNYSGSYLDEFKAFVAAKAIFTSTAPSEYDATIAEIEKATADMNSRIAIVDNYYKAYQAALDMDTLYSDSTGYKELVAFAAVKKAIADYAELDVTIKNNDELNAITAEVSATTTAMTDRCAAIDEFNGNCEESVYMIEENNKLSYLTEYKTLVDVFNTNKDLEKFAVTDEELNGINDAFNNAISKFSGKIAAAAVVTNQIVKLAEMADALVTDWGTVDSKDIEAQIKNELEDNQALANVLQIAIKAAIEAQIDTEESVDEAGIDMTHFIQNAINYTQSTNKNIVAGEESLPGWTVVSASGQVMHDYDWNNLTATTDRPAVDGYIAFGWGNNATVSQKIKNLPVGKYKIGGTFAKNESNNGGSSSFIIMQYDSADELVYSDTLSTSWTNGETPDFFKEGFTVLEGTTSIELVANISSTTWGRFDNWQLTLVEAIEGYDYGAAATASKAALGEAYTGVNQIVSPENIQYYNLNGMKVSEPLNGINIRISTGKNGERKVEKVLIK